MTVLAVDVGNTRTKCALCEPGQPLPACMRVVEVPNTSATDVLQALAGLAASGLDNTIISGSNTRLRDQLLLSWEQAGPTPQVLAKWHQIGLRVNLTTPETTGLDRLLNAWGAIQLWPRSTVVIVDVGTATTVDLVAEGEFQGGAILPGLALSARALHEHTDALPLIETDSLHPSAVVPVGKNTTEAIQAGVILGQIGAIRELTTLIEQDHPTATLVLTGGASSQLAGSFAKAEVEPWLGLRALASLASAVK